MQDYLEYMNTLSSVISDRNNEIAQAQRDYASKIPGVEEKKSEIEAATGLPSSIFLEKGINNFLLKKEGRSYLQKQAKNIFNKGKQYYEDNFSKNVAERAEQGGTQTGKLSEQTFDNPLFDPESAPEAEPVEPATDVSAPTEITPETEAVYNPVKRPTTLGTFKEQPVDEYGQNVRVNTISAESEGTPQMTAQANPSANPAATDVGTTRDLASVQSDVSKTIQANIKRSATDPEFAETLAEGTGEAAGEGAGAAAGEGAGAGVGEGITEGVGAALDADPFTALIGLFVGIAGLVGGIEGAKSVKNPPKPKIPTQEQVQIQYGAGGF